MLTRFFGRARFSHLLRFAPGLLAGFLILAASPLRAQTFTPTLTVGAGIQTSYDHTEPSSGTSLDQFNLNHLRLYFSGDITKYISAPTISPGIATMKKTHRQLGTIARSCVAIIGPNPRPNSANDDC